MDALGNPEFLYTNQNNTIPKKFIYKINSKNLGPFEFPDTQLKLFLNDVIEFRLNHTYKTYIPKFYYDYFSCSLWNIHQIYNFGSRGHFNVKLKIERVACEDLNIKYSYINLFINKLLWMHLIIIILAVYSLLYSWTTINKIFDRYLKAKSKVPNKVNIYFINLRILMKIMKGLKKK